jgi:glycosyltransferase involved in cell wall biosynthesis
MSGVIVYRNELLPPSETFVLAQASAMRRYRPTFLGLRTTEPSLLNPSDCLLAEHDSLLPRPLRSIAYTGSGVAPALHRPSFLQRLKAANPALVHAHFSTDALNALPIARALNIPLIVTLHGYDVTADQRGMNPLRNSILAARKRALWRHTSVFLCVSEFIRECALAAGFPADKLVVHRIGIDVARFKPRPSPPSHDVVFVGRLTEKKGCAYLLAAMQKVRRTVPDARLILIGDGPLRQPLQELAASLDAGCTFLGRQSHEQVLEAIAAARVCAIPSVTAANGDSEGLPMILAEAQALGVPVVGTRHAGIPEGIVDGHAGLLSDERDVSGLARNLKRVLQDDALHADLSRRGIELVLHDCNLQLQTEQLESIYDAVLTSASLQPSTCFSARATAK